MAVSAQSTSPEKLSLAVQNAHPRDARIIFIADDHTYWLDGVNRFPISVSGVWQTFFDKFDAERTVDMYYIHWSRKEASPYHALIHSLREEGKTDAEVKTSIIASWNMTGQTASREGTIMHREIEYRLNYNHDDDYTYAGTPEMIQFGKFMEEFATPRGWKTYRTEWSIYDEKRMIAGQIDCVFHCQETGEYHMVDWKRSKQILDPKIGEQYGRRGLPPCHFMIDNPFSNYAAQQNLYAVMLLDNYDLRISTMWLVQLHPLQKNFKAHRVPPFFPAARHMLDRCASTAK
jgi:hypothetical protein